MVVFLDFQPTFIQTFIWLITAGTNSMYILMHANLTNRAVRMGQCFYRYTVYRNFCEWPGYKVLKQMISAKRYTTFPLGLGILRKYFGRIVGIQLLQIISDILVHHYRSLIFCFFGSPSIIESGFLKGITKIISKLCSAIDEGPNSRFHVKILRLFTRYEFFLNTFHMKLKNWIPGIIFPIG